MTNELQTSELVEKITDFIGRNKDHFVALNENGLNRLDFVKECEFAKQLLTRNDYILEVARSNPDSLHAAISNVAAIGITLNPALQFAYLVPRKVNKKLSICLDISYRGLIKLATDTGIIKAMKAELVYQNDTFTYRGFHVEPEFACNPFVDRGELIGVYAMGLLRDGSVLVETMTIDEVNAIRDDSEAYKSAISKGLDSWELKNNVWVKFYTEMVKKTVIKRAYKTLPTSKGMETVGKAIDVLNEHEGIEFHEEAKLHFTAEESEEYKRCLEDGDYYNLTALEWSLSPEAKLQLEKLHMPEAAKGEKGKQKELRKTATEEAKLKLDDTVNIVTELLQNGDDYGVNEILTECNQWVLNYIKAKLSHESVIQLSQIMEATNE